MWQIILIFIMFILTYLVGRNMGERQALKRVKTYIVVSKNWDTFIEFMNKEWNEYDIN